MESGLAVRCTADGVSCSGANRVDTTRLAAVVHNPAYQLLREGSERIGVRRA